VLVAGSSDLVAAKRLLDEARDRGFAFVRIAPGKTDRCGVCGRALGGLMRSIWAGSPRDVTQSAGGAVR
jgi:hypothetical protein